MCVRTRPLGFLLAAIPAVLDVSFARAATQLCNAQTCIRTVVRHGTALRAARDVHAAVHVQMRGWDGRRPPELRFQ